MNPHTLPVKRRPASKRFFRRLNAVTGNRKQRAAAATAADMEMDDGGSKISRALTIIFLIHIVAIGLLFVHKRFLEGRPQDSVGSVANTVVEHQAPVVAVEQPVEPRRESLPQLTSGEKPYVVKPGDNYGRIAAAAGVDEQDLRQINQHANIGPGLILKIPPKRIVAEEPAEVTAIRAQVPSDRDRGLVDAVDVSNAPRAHPVKVETTKVKGGGTKAEPAVETTSRATGKSYVVQSGDSVSRIAGRYKVDQKALMRANSISDPRKMKVGMKLVIPSN